MKRLVKILILSAGFAAFVACMGPGKTARATPTNAQTKYLGPEDSVPADRIAYRLDSGPTIITGTVSLRPWRKSGLSYCAQGGSFPAITNKRRSTVLVFHDKRLWKRVMDRKTHQKLRGVYLRKFIPHPKIGQHPVTGKPYFECRVFEVRGQAK